MKEIALATEESLVCAEFDVSANNLQVAESFHVDILDSSDNAKGRLLHGRGYG